jgi:hypothetical protein
MTPPIVAVATPITIALAGLTPLERAISAPVTENRAKPTASHQIKIRSSDCTECTTKNAAQATKTQVSKWAGL